MAKTGIAKLFRNGRSPAVRLPPEFRFAGDRVRIRRIDQGVLLESLIPNAAEWFDELNRFNPEPFFVKRRNQPSPRSLSELFARHQCLHRTHQWQATHCPRQISKRHRRSPGPAKSSHREFNKKRLEVFLAGPAHPLPFQDVDAELAGAIRADLESIGKPIGAYDLLIAGQAMRNKLTLITANFSEFARIKALAWADWGKP